MLRPLRKALTERVIRSVGELAPRLTPRTIECWSARLAALGPHIPIVGRQVRDNMRRAGIATPVAPRAYFRQLGQHFAGALHALHWADDGTAGDISPQLARYTANHVTLDASVTGLHEARRLNRGVILMGPHICNYLISLARLNQDIPLTIYLRHSKDPRRTALKERWYRAAGIQWIAEPADAGGALGRIRRMSAALRANRVLFITPDLPQKPAAGVAVRWLDRVIYLPAGPALLSLRSGAPLYMLTATVAGAAQRLSVTGPCPAPPPGKGSAARQHAVQQRLQWFADEFAAFLHAEPALWYLWGDKRWTRVVHHDPRYTSPLPTTRAGRVAANAGA